MLYIIHESKVRRKGIRCCNPKFWADIAIFSLEIQKTSFAAQWRAFEASHSSTKSWLIYQQEVKVKASSDAMSSSPSARISPKQNPLIGDISETKMCAFSKPFASALSTSSSDHMR